MTILEWSIIVILIIGSFVYALYLAVFLQVLNMKLGLTILFLEFRSLLQPKIKIVTFLIMMQMDIKSELSMIVGMSDKKLLAEYQVVYGHEKISLADIKKIKKEATHLLNKSKNEELISYDEVRKILKGEGILNFFSALKRSVKRYSSFEQQERFIESEEVNALWSLITRERKTTVETNKEILKDSLKPLRKKYAELYINKHLLSAELK